MDHYKAAAWAEGRGGSLPTREQGDYLATLKGKLEICPAKPDVGGAFTEHDLFIGDTSYLGIGWGRLILVKFLNEIAFPLFPGENLCWIYHEKLNERALRASQAAGFRFVRDFIEDGSEKELLSLDKGECARLALSTVTG